MPRLTRRLLNRQSVADRSPPPCRPPRARRRRCVRTRSCSLTHSSSASLACFTRCSRMRSWPPASSLPVRRLPELSGTRHQTSACVTKLHCTTLYCSALQFWAWSPRAVLQCCNASIAVSVTIQTGGSALGNASFSSLFLTDFVCPLLTTSTSTAHSCHVSLLACFSHIHNFCSQPYRHTGRRASPSFRTQR